MFKQTSKPMHNPDIMKTRNDIYTNLRPVSRTTLNTLLMHRPKLYKLIWLSPHPNTITVPQRVLTKSPKFNPLEEEEADAFIKNATEGSVINEKDFHI